MSRIQKCPNCQDSLIISEFSCPACETKIKGEFPIEESSSMFERFSEEERYFILVFLQCAGVIQDVEKIMGISYPTVKAKLSNIQKKLEGNHFHESEEEFDKVRFKEEMKELKNKIREKMKGHVRASVRGAFFGVDPCDVRTGRSSCCETSKTSEKEESKEATKSVKEILDRLEAGEIDLESALNEINSKRKS